MIPELIGEIFHSENSRRYLRLFVRAAIQTTLVATNVKQVATGQLVGAFIVGFLISLSWAYNVKDIASDLKAAVDGVGARIAPFSYAFGAGIGTVAGILIPDLISGLWRILF